MTLAKVRWISTSKGITFWSLPSVAHLEIGSQTGFGRANPFGDRFNWKIIIKHISKARNVRDLEIFWWLWWSWKATFPRSMSTSTCPSQERIGCCVCVCVCRTFRSYLPNICHVKCHSVASNQRQSTGSWAPIHGFCCTGEFVALCWRLREWKISWSLHTFAQCLCSWLWKGKDKGIFRLKYVFCYF